MSIATRALIGVGALGGIGGMGYALHRQLSTDNIGKKLVANGHKLLSDTEDSVWTEILKHYKERIEANKKDLQFGDFDGKVPNENTVNTLKNKCKEVLKEVSTNQENYKKAEKWCTVPKTLTKILEEKGYKPLLSDTGKDEDKEEWDKKLDAYDKSSETAKKFNSLELKTPPQTLEKNKITRDKLKGKCKELESKKHYEKDFEEELNKSILWCSVQIKKDK